MMKDYSVLDGMRKQTSEIMMQAFEKGYKQGYADGQQGTGKEYDEGLNDAWDAARKIMKIWVYDAKCNPNRFDTLLDLDADPGEDVFGKLFRKYAADKAVAKIKEYEEKQRRSCDTCGHDNPSAYCVLCGNDKKEWTPKRPQEDRIRIGDEVYIISRNHPFIVTHITGNGFVVGISARGMIVDAVHVGHLHKTGRRFSQVKEMMDQAEYKSCENCKNMLLSDKIEPCKSCVHNSIDGTGKENWEQQETHV